MPWTLRMTLYSFLIAVIPYCYVAWRLINAFSVVFPNSSRMARTGVILLVILVNLLPLVVLLYHLTNNSDHLFFHNPELTFFDYVFQFPFWLGLIIILEVFPYFLASDVVQLTVRIFTDKYFSSWSYWLAYVRISLIVFFIIFVNFRVYTDTYQVRTVTQDIRIKNLPSALDNLSLLLVADLQIDRYTQETKISEFKDQLQSHPADLLIFTGDLVTRGTHFIPQGVRVLCDTKAELGRIACVGDHDFWSDAHSIAKGLKNCGWIFLDNAHHIIQMDSAKILVTGISQIYSKRISNRELDDVLKNAPHADLKILIVHQPAEKVIRAAEHYGYNIMVAGHTHGGQVVFKPFGFTLTATQLENHIWSGFEKWKNLNIFVSNGIGVTLMPFRYRAPADIVKINIYQE